MPPITPTLPTPPWFARRSASRHIVVCGSNQLAYRIVEELIGRHGEYVTVIVPTRTTNRAPDIAELDGVRIVEATRLDGKAFQAARLHQARALALASSDDVGNLHAALRAQEVNPDLRLVIRMGNRNLRARLHNLFPDCTALSDASTAAPAFVAAAIDRAVVPLRGPDCSLVAIARRDVPDDHVVCTLASDSDLTGRPELLPDTDEPDDLVLAIADGQRYAAGDDEEEVVERASRRRRLARLLRYAVRLGPRRGLALVIVALAAVVVVGIVLRVVMLHQQPGFSLYDSLLTIAGAGDPDSESTTEQVIQTVTMLAGVSLTPAITAALVDWAVRIRISSVVRTGAIPRAGHVVVTGLGDVGMRIVRQLNDMGEPVVAIETDEHVPGVASVRRLGVPVIIGDATEPETLAKAHVQNCRALVPATSDDATNLEIGLNARADHPDLRVVLRLFDADLAARVQEHLGITTSRSVAYLAAPRFAAALVDRLVINTIPVGRRVLVIADIPVEYGTGLSGLTVEDVHETGQSRVIAVRLGDEWQWAPAADQRLRDKQRILLLATRSGLGAILARNALLDDPA